MEVENLVGDGDGGGAVRPAAAEAAHGRRAEESRHASSSRDFIYGFYIWWPQVGGKGGGGIPERRSSVWHETPESGLGRPSR